MSETSGSTVEWSQLYAGIEETGKVPYASSEVISSSHATFQAMYLDLGDIKTKLTASALNPPLVAIYADVLNIPAELSWMLQDSVLVIVARLIQGKAPLTVSLDYRTTETASLVVYAQKIQGTINAVTVPQAGNSPGPIEFSLTTAPANGGLQISSVDGTPTNSPRSWAQGMPVQLPDAFQQALTTEFIFASLLYVQHPDIALAQLRWLTDWTAQSPDLLGAYFRSASLLALLSAQTNAQENGAAFVPYLNAQVYSNLATAFVAEAQQYEGDYRDLSTQMLVTDNFVLLAKQLLKNQTYQTEYAHTLLAQAKGNYNSAVSSVTAAQSSFDKAMHTAKAMQIQFEDVGIPAWKKAKILDAVISLTTAVVTFGVGIAATLAGDPAAGAAGAGAAIEGAAAVEKAAEAGTAMANLAKQLVDVMTKLKKIIDALGKVYEFSQRIVAVASDISKAESEVQTLQHMDIDTGGVDLSASYEWQAYQLTANAALQGPVDEGVPYADDLKTAVNAVAIYGQALAAAQLSAVTSGQAYANIALQYELSQRQQDTLENYVGSLQIGRAPTTEMMQQFYQRYLDAKSSLFSAIEEYRASYFYWALEPSSTRPQIIDSVNALSTGLTNLTAIALDQASALQHFPSPPQEMRSKRIVIDNPATLDRLRKEGAASWTIEPGTNTFEGLDRIRLWRVRTWLEGTGQKTGTAQVNVTINTTGSYQDRLAGTGFQFTSKPLTRGFEYRIARNLDGEPDWRFDDGTFGYIEVDGVVNHEVSYAYFEPTPFTEWRIDLSTHNPGLDLSNVSKITMEFAGTVIPA